MSTIERVIHLTYIGWKDGDQILTDQEILDKVDAVRLSRQAAKQVVLTKLGITADELLSLLAYY